MWCNIIDTLEHPDLITFGHLGYHNSLKNDKDNTAKEISNLSSQGSHFNITTILP